MNFRNKERDLPLYQQMLNSRALTMREWQAFDIPDREELDLFEVLFGNAAAIDGNRWVHWLVKQHGMTRINNPRHDRQWILSQNFSPADAMKVLHGKVYPMGMSGRMLQLGAVCPNPAACKWLLGRLKPAAHCIMALTPQDGIAPDRLFTSIAESAGQ